MKFKEFWNVVEKSDSNHGDYERFARVDMSREICKNLIAFAERLILQFFTVEHST